MTDNEIIKALEDAINPLKDISPEGASLVGIDTLLKVIDLINRQRAEIVKLEKIKHFADKTIEALKRENEKQKAEIERLQAERDKEHQYAMHYAIMCAKAGDEAIKEFTSRIEGVLSMHPAQAKYYYYEIKKEYIKEKQNETD